ncbi:MAG: hypothetical protein U0P45_14205 [Acidimicrobiales bacterium]
MTRFLVLAPMPVELAAVAKAMRLARARGGEGERRHRGEVGSHEVVAVLAGIGPTRSGEATARAIEADHPDHVLAVGIAGGVRPTIAVGDLLVPATVRDLDDGQEHGAHALGGVDLEGLLVTSAELILDRSVHEANATAGVDAIDMETSAIAAAAEAAGLPWTAFRGISDHVLEGLMDEGTLGLLKPDGSPDVGAAVRYLAKRPTGARTLARLASGTKAATTVAARAAAGAIARS